MSIGGELKQLRKKRGITQKELALKLNLSENYLSLIENGHRLPTLTTLLEMLKVLKGYLVIKEQDVEEN